MMTIVRVAVGAAAVLFIVVYLIAIWGQIRFDFRSFRWEFLALSWVLLGCAFLINGLVWKILLSGNGKTAGYFSAVFMVSLSLLMRYIPGKIWQLAGRFTMAHDRGFDRNTIVVSLVEENAADICGAIIMAYAVFGSRMGLYGVLFLGAIAGAALVLTLPSIRIRLRIPMVRGGKIAVASLLYIAGWMVYGAAFYCAVRSMYWLDASNLRLCTGALAAAWLGSMVGFIVPNGLGVREGILVLLLSPVLSAPQAMAAALVFRIGSTAFELCCGGSLYFVNLWKKSGAAA
jgi:glycosyltransferase 2 family protein